ncbi:MAG TPA: matrixin family metalloprotease [Candidatus Paceibacterota bacterium]|nr:matrixin family metalloprotease [Candidatus Paceibacterota bacterium]HMO82847.1 matrixin family metalloprotease [Candidatus Paceibacterota bacterium]
MRGLIIFILIFTLMFSTSYWYVSTSHICPIPIAYRLGDTDPRFTISAEEAKSVLAAAEAVWEDAVGRNLFVYDEEATFALNFIYDERQQLASTEEEWRIDLDRKEAESREILEQVKVNARQYEAAQAAYEQERAGYDNRLKDYNQEVERVNQQGGASPEAYAELQRKQKALAEELAGLIDQEKELNSRINAINEQGERGNRLIERYNEEVVRYNEIYGNLNIYTQGDFQRDRINIYKFSDTTELTRVIAHEFGHALGLGHVDDESSVMYYLMTEQSGPSQLSAEDKKAFILACGDSTSFSQAGRQMIRKTLAKLF